MFDFCEFRFDRAITLREGGRGRVGFQELTKKKQAKMITLNMFE